MVQGQEDPAAAPLQGDKTKPKKSSGAGVNICVLLLDGSKFETQLPKNAPGHELVDRVCEHLSLVEKDYFSCSYRDRHNVRLWIHDDRPLSKAGKRAHPNWEFSFEVKFYPLDAGALREDYTRYLIFLQTRVDIVMGKLPSSFLALALLGSYAVQSDLGDHNPSEHGNNSDYIKDIKFAQKQTDELLDKIAELHATHRGQRPDEAEQNYLENAEKLAQYGMHMHQAKDAENVDVNIGVGAIGLVIYNNQIRVHRFPWAKIMKIAYKRNSFTIKIRPEIANEPQQIIVYKLGSNVLAKRLWRIAVEHHGFFRLKQPDPAQRAQFPHFGSKFRYSGRTQYQVRGSTDAPAGRIVPKINRKASTRFIGARDTNIHVGTGGYSTDRGEQYHTVEEPQCNTLDLKKRLNRPAGGTVPRADFEDDQNLSVIDPGGNYGGPDKDTVVVTTAQVKFTKGGYQTGTGTSFNQDTSIDEFSNADTLTGRYPTGSMDQGNRSTNGSRYGTDNDDSLRYQEDQRLNKAGGAAGGGQWGAGYVSSTSTKTKTSTRTYTEADGTVVTEVTTEKDGVIERKIERREATKSVMVTNGGDDIDYDKALLEAIQSVTNMDQGLSVEKIEIHTKSETSH